MARSALLVWIWLAAAVFVLGCAWRAWRYARAPLHLRWDLYPVAHEPPARRAHGGSYFEERGWWTRSHPRSLGGELTATLAEILLLRGVRANNRRVYRGSLPFHWGLYLLVATSLALVALALGGERRELVLASTGAAVAGGTLLAVGSLVLLWLRATDRGLRRYTSSLDRVNLALFACLGALSVAVALGPGGLELVAADVALLLRFQVPLAPPLHAAQMALAGLILTYLPFTRMVHFFAKYFLYHRVRWDDRPTEEGSGTDRRIRAALDLGVSWSADHVGAGRTWTEVAREVPPKTGRP